jgi:hypothetical protein
MTYTVTSTRRKPEGVSWWVDQNPEHWASKLALQEWEKAQTGLISHTIEDPDTNTSISTYVFDTKGNYDAFMSAIRLQPEYKIYWTRNIYNDSVGITTETTQVES